MTASRGGPEEKGSGACGTTGPQRVSAWPTSVGAGGEAPMVPRAAQYLQQAPV